MSETLFDSEAENINGNILDLRVLRQGGIQDWRYVSLYNG